MATIQSFQLSKRWPAEERYETRVWLDFAVACGYLTAEDHRALDRECHSILARLVHMIDHADQWAVGRPAKSSVDRKIRRSRGRALGGGSYEKGGREPSPQSPSQGTETNEGLRGEPSATRTDPQSRRTTPRRQP